MSEKELNEALKRKAALKILYDAAEQNLDRDGSIYEEWPELYEAIWYFQNEVYRAVPPKYPLTDEDRMESIRWADGRQPQRVDKWWEKTLDEIRDEARAKGGMKQKISGREQTR